MHNPTFNSKEKEIIINAEPYFKGFALVRIWRGKEELAVLSLPIKTVNNNDELLKIVNPLLLEIIREGGKWKE